MKRGSQAGGVERNSPGGKNSRSVGLEVERSQRRLFLL